MWKWTSYNSFDTYPRMYFSQDKKYIFVAQYTTETTYLRKINAENGGTIISKSFNFKRLQKFAVTKESNIIVSAEALYDANLRYYYYSNFNLIKEYARAEYLFPGK
ncbi:hypothetical protein [Clostridium sp. UBA6640]|uniref:hypothetical protein n=1 Tax=Clostridium sp. UBA6640 TaxID=1946370 RepID=UPI0025C6FA0C|nr:hypothetical protein [Clostridium sp. UBA6640]